MDRLESIVESFNARSRLARVLGVSLIPPGRLALRLMDNEHVMDPGKVAVDRDRVVINMDGATLAFTADGSILFGERGYVAAAIPLFQASGFTEDSILLFIVSGTGFGLSKVSHTLETISVKRAELLRLEDVLPRRTVISRNGGGALSYLQYSPLRGAQADTYLRLILAPDLFEKILFETLDVRPSRWAGDSISLYGRPDYIVDLGGIEAVVMTMLLERPLTESDAAVMLSRLMRLKKKYSRKAGILVSLYVEHVRLPGSYTYTPRFFWYVVLNEDGKFAAPSVRQGGWPGYGGQFKIYGV